MRNGLPDPGYGECITIALSQALATFRAMHVIAAQTTLQLEDWYASAPQLAAYRLGARFIVYGAVEQVEDTLVFRLRLVDREARNSRPLEPVEVPIGRLQEGEVRVVSQILRVLMPEVGQAEIHAALAKPHELLDVRELVLKAIVAMHGLTRAALDEAEELLREALAKDPEYASAWAWLARLWSIRIGQGFVSDRQSAAAAALDHAQRAVANDERDALALATLGHNHSYLRRDPMAGRRYLVRAVRACPNEALAWLLLGVNLAYTGQVNRGLRRAEYALQLSPLDPYAYMFRSFAGLCAWSAGWYGLAVEHLKIAERLNPKYSTTLKLLAACYAGLGMWEEAENAGKRLLEIEPEFPTYAAITVPVVVPELRERWLTQLEQAKVLPKRGFGPRINAAE
jgi:adenylate cyclase